MWYRRTTDISQVALNELEYYFSIKAVKSSYFSTSYREVYISGTSHYMSVVYAFVCLSSVNKYHYVKFNLCV